MKSRLVLFLVIIGVSTSLLSQNCVRAGWVKKYGVGGSEGFYEMCADSGRLSFTVCGFFESSMTLGATTITSPTGRGYYIARFDTAGNPLMLGLLGYATAASGVYIQPRQICTDDAGNVYVSGECGGNSVTIQGNTFNYTVFGNMFVAKFAANGAPLWVRSVYNGSSSGAYGLAVDSAGNAYVTGTFEGTSLIFDNDTLYNRNIPNPFYSDGYIAALDPNGQFVWAQNFGTLQDDGGQNIALDGMGNLFLTGNLDFGNATFSPTAGVITVRQDWNFFVAKYTTSGTALWVRTIEGYGSSEMYSYDSDCDDAGNFYMTGECSGTYAYGNSIVATTATASDDAYLAKFRPDGTCAWVKLGGGSNGDRGYALDVYQEKVAWCGDIFSNNPVFGNLTVPVPSTNTFTAVTDTAGTMLWARTYCATLSEVANGTFIDASGIIYTSGSFVQSETWYPVTIAPTGAADGYVVKFKLSSSATPAVNAGPDRTTSCGVSVQLTGTSVTPGSTYQWQGPNGFTTSTLSPSVNPGFTSNYTLTANYQGCISSDVTLVTVSPNGVNADAGTDVSICSGDSVQLNATSTPAGSTYTWLPAFGLSSTTIANPWAKPLQTTDYIVCALNGNCRDYDTVRVTVNQKPYLSIASGYSTCAGVPVTLIAGPSGPSFNWTPSTGLSSTTTHTTVATPATTQNYTITATTAAGCSRTATTTFQVLNNNVAPTITTQPLNQTICAGNQITFSCGATGSAAVLYRWEMNTGSGWIQVPASAPYSGTSSGVLTINPVTAALNGYQFRCRTYSSCSPITYSNPATLTVSPVPVISVHPPNRNICPTNNTTMSVTVPGTGYTYQWQGDFGSGFVNLVNGPPYSGVTTTVLAISNATAAMNGYQYRVIVTGCSPSASATSNSALLTVGQPPLIQSQPIDDTSCTGGTAVFTVAQTGGTGYAWQYYNGSTWQFLTNTSPYSGVNTATLTITPLSIAQNGLPIRCRISGGCSTITYSDTVSVLIEPAASVVSSPAGVTACPGDSITFSASANNALNYQWEVNTGSGFLPLSNSAPYSGVNTATLSVAPVSAAMNGYLYRLTVNGACSSIASTSSATLNIPSLLMLNGQPDNDTTCINSSAVFSVGATNALSYQWEMNDGSGWITLSNTSPFSGTATATLTVNPVMTAMNGYYFRAIMTGNCGDTITSDSAQLVFSAGVAILSQPASVAICENDSVNFTFAASGASAYQWEADFGSGFTSLSNNATYSGVTTNQLSVNGVSFSMNGTMYRCIVLGCTGNDTTQVSSLTVHPLPAVSFAPLGAACINWSAFTLSGGSPAGGTYSGPGVSGTTFDPATAGAGYHTLVYTFVDVNGCSDTAQQVVFVDLCTSVAADPSNENITLYPNPATDEVTIVLQSEANTFCRVDVFSAEGKQMQSNAYAMNGKTTISMNFSGYARGVYFVHVITEGEARMIRLVLI